MEEKKKGYKFLYILKASVLMLVASILLYTPGAYAASVKWTSLVADTSGSINFGKNPVVVPAPNNRYYAVWEDQRTAVYDIYAQKIDDLGNGVWGVNGKPVCTAAGNQYGVRAISDGNGDLIIAWVDARGSSTDVYAQKLNSSGTELWAPGGVTVCSAVNGQFDAEIVSDNLGGVIITWTDARTSASNTDIYAQRVNSLGSVVWTVNGVSISGAQTNNQEKPKLIPDGAGGAIIVWQDARLGLTNTDIYVQKIVLGGTVSWAAGGVSLCNQTGSNQNEPVMCSDGADGAIVAWDDMRDGYGDIYAQRVTSAGARSWGVTGIAVCSVAASTQARPRIIPYMDIFSGAFIVWEDDRNGLSNVDIYAQRLNSSGTSQWTANGNMICGSANNQKQPRMIPDGAGGAIISWKDDRNDTGDIYAQRISYMSVPLWGANGMAVNTNTDSQINPNMCKGVKPGDALIAFDDYSPGDNFLARAAYVEETNNPALLGNSSERTEIEYSFQIDDNNKKISYRFKAPYSMTIRTIRTYSAAITGAPVYDVGIMADNSGNPSGTYLSYTSMGPNANNWSSFDIPDYTLTAGTVYHVVVRANNVSVSAYTNFAYSLPAVIPVPRDQQVMSEFRARTTTDGTAWSDAGAPIFILEEAGGRHFGNSYKTASVYSVYETGASARFSGEEFPGPDTATAISGVQFLLRKAGTPVSDLYYCLYDASNKVTMTSGVLLTSAAASLNYTWVGTSFSSQTLYPGTTYRVFVYTTAAGGDTFNCYQGLAGSDNMLFSGIHDYVSYGGIQHKQFSTTNGGLSMIYNQYNDYLFRLEPPVVPTATYTITPTATRTNTPTYTRTSTPTFTGTRTQTPTFTATRTRTATPTVTATESGCGGVTFGTTSIGGSAAGNANYLDGNRYWVASALQLVALNIHLSVAGNFRLALYSDSGGGSPVPVNLIVETGSIAGITGWNKVSVGPVAIGPGWYWIVHQVSLPGQINYTTLGSNYYKPYTYGFFPVTFPAAGTNASWLWSMYADTCPGAPTSTPTPTWTLTQVITFTITPTYTITPTNTPHYYVVKKDPGVIHKLNVSAQNVNVIESGRNSINGQSIMIYKFSNNAAEDQNYINEIMNCGDFIYKQDIGSDTGNNDYKYVGEP